MKLVPNTPLPEYAPDVGSIQELDDLDVDRRLHIADELGERVDVFANLDRQTITRRIRVLGSTVPSNDRSSLLAVAGYCQALVERIDRSEAVE